MWDKKVKKGEARLTKNADKSGAGKQVVYIEERLIVNDHRSRLGTKRYDKSRPSLCTLRP